MKLKHFEFSIFFVENRNCLKVLLICVINNLFIIAHIIVQSSTYNRFAIEIIIHNETYTLIVENKNQEIFIINSIRQSIKNNKLILNNETICYC